LLVGAHRLPV